MVMYNKTDFGIGKLHELNPMYIFSYTLAFLYYISWNQWSSIKPVKVSKEEIGGIFKIVKW